MKTAKERANQVNSILARYGVSPKGELRLTYEEIAEAKQHIATIRQIQKEIRQAKKEIGLDIKEIRATYAAKKARVQSSASLTSLFKIKGAGHYRAIQKQNLTSTQNKEIEPYTNLSVSIDQMVLALDGVKTKLELWISEKKSAS